MNPVDPNLALLELIAAALGPLCARFVFVGGCATGMLVTRNPEFNQALPGHLAGDETGQARMPLIKERLRQLSLAA
jgi:hypothetical protein